jgi:hypothetical protein
VDLKVILDKKLGERKSRIEQDKALIKDAIKGFMDDHPEVEFLEVKTYTPSFNDGDPCEFTITDPRVILKEDGRESDRLAITVEDDDDDEDDDDEDLDFDEHGYESYQLDEQKHPKLKADMEAIGELFETVAEAFEDLFGNGSSIVVSQCGEAKVTEYDCGF